MQDTIITDPRIVNYCTAMSKMKAGVFSITLPVEDTGDEVAKLGYELSELAGALEQRFLEQKKLNHVTEQINAGLLLDEVLDHVFESFRTIIPYDRIGISLLEKDGTVLRSRWARTDMPNIMLKKNFSAPMAGSSLQQIIETGQPRIINDLLAYLEQRPKSVSTRLVVSEGIRSSLTCPLIADNKAIGFIFFSSSSIGTYCDTHAELFLKIAAILSTTIEKSRLYQRLAELNQTKNRFLGIAAHDLRNPLSAVQGYTRLFLNGKLGALNQSQRKIVTRMQAACDRMLGLVEDLLDVSAIEAGSLDLKHQLVDIGEFLHDIYDMNYVIAQEKSIKLQLKIDDSIGIISFDPHRMAQAVNNLIGNAIKFSHPDTTVTIVAICDNSKIKISVIDQGVGIPSDEIEQVFIEFGRCSSMPTAGEKSTGLGLAIVSRIIEAHGGTVHVESKLGQGSTFTISLPMRRN